MKCSDLSRALRPCFERARLQAEPQVPTKPWALAAEESLVRQFLRPHFRLRPGPPLRIQRERLAEIKHLLADTQQNRPVRPMQQHFRDPLPDLPHLRFLHPTRGKCRRADTYTTRLHRRIRVEWNRILVDRDPGLAQRFLRLASQHALR